MASNPRNFCLSCELKKCFKCFNSYYIDEHIPQQFRQSIKKYVPVLKENDIFLEDFIRSGLFGCVCSAKMNGKRVAIKVVINKRQTNFDKEFEII